MCRDGHWCVRMESGAELEAAEVMDVFLEGGLAILVAAALFWSMGAVGGLMVRAIEELPGYDRVMHFFAVNLSQRQRSASVWFSYMQLWCWALPLVGFGESILVVAFVQRSVAMACFAFFFSFSMAIVMCTMFAIYERVWIGRVPMEERLEAMAPHAILRWRLVRAAQRPRMFVLRVLRG